MKTPAETGIKDGLTGERDVSVGCSKKDNSVLVERNEMDENSNNVRDAGFELIGTIRKP